MDRSAPGQATYIELSNRDDNVDNKYQDGDLKSNGPKSLMAVAGYDNIGQDEKKDLEKDTEAGDEQPKRADGWDSKTDFILACIGYAVGLGNVWRFPYLVYKNGGGAFLIPYTICLIFLGIPIFYMEVGLGQYLQLGGISAWNVVPCFKGVGYSSATIGCMLNIYYIVIIAWINVYLLFSFFPTLPWTLCDAFWNDEYCYDYKTHNTTDNGTAFLGGEYYNITINMTDSETPAEQFWNDFVLRMSDGIHDIGSPIWYLAISLALAWLLTYACIVKGVKTTGKIVWFTTTFPYVILTILLIRACTLPGADDGIYYYLVPDWSRLLDAQVWVDAGSQIFFSLGVGIASLISLGSYNKYNNNIVIDTFVVCIVNCLTSFYGGFMVFATLGFMAWTQNVEVADVVDSGPGLIFVTVPTAIAEMPAPQFWAVMFFIMLLLLGLDSQFCVVEGFYTCLADEYPKYLRKHRAKCLAVLCLVYYCLALPCITNAGIYFFTLMDGYAASGYALLWVALWECITIGYVFGVKRFLAAMKDMMGKQPSMAWPACWCVISPLILIFILLFSYITYGGAYYGDHYRYPLWGEILGWLMAAASMHWVVTYFIYAFIITPGNFQERWEIIRNPHPRLVLRHETYEVNSKEVIDDGSIQPITELNDDPADASGSGSSDNSVPPSYEKSMAPPEATTPM